MLANHQCKGSCETHQNLEILLCRAVGSPTVITMNTLINADDSSTTTTSSIAANWDADTENTPVYAVVSAVAEAEGVDPVDLPALYETIDPEALNDLFLSDPGTAITVEFRYAGYSVTVRGGGTVEVSSTSR